MAYEVNRPEENPAQKPRLSALGKWVAGAVAAVLLLSLGIYWAGAGDRAEKQALHEALVAAVDRSVVVCKNALSAVNAPAAQTEALQKAIEGIQKQSSLEKAAEAAQQMISDTLLKVGGNQAQTDELIGARNRILLALQNLQAKK